MSSIIPRAPLNDVTLPHLSLSMRPVWSFLIMQYDLLPVIACNYMIYFYFVSIWDVRSGIQYRIQRFETESIAVEDWTYITWRWKLLWTTCRMNHESGLFYQSCRHFSVRCAPLYILLSLFISHNIIDHRWSVKLFQIVFIKHVELSPFRSTHCRKTFNQYLCLVFKWILNHP